MRRKSSRRKRYGYGAAGDEVLVGLLKGLPRTAIQSWYPSALHDELLDNWCRVPLQVTNPAAMVIEKVWFNLERDMVYWLSLGRAISRITKTDCLNPMSHAVTRTAP